MTYTAHLNAKIALPSGNWFSGFKADAESRTVVYTYHDRRRNGQVARHYMVTFKADLSTIESVTAVSAHGGRVEHFKTVSIRGDLAIILRAAVREALEKSFADEVEDVEQDADTLEQDSASVDDTASNTSTALLDTLKMVGGMVMINMIVTLATLGIVWYNL